MKMTILRGIPGAGKSFFARPLLDAGAALASADSFFMVEGEYIFNPALIGQAHGFCFKTALAAVQSGRDVVVDNTATSIAEIAPYMLLGTSHDYQVEIVLVQPPSVEIAAARNTHGVPAEVVQRMADAIARDTLPPWWAQRTVQGQ